MVYPGFLDPAKHPEGLCLPCCFSLPQNNPKSSKYVKFKKCLGDEVNNVNVKKDQIYILGKVSPLEKDRYGKLPYDVAKLLKTTLETGYLGNDSGYLKKGIKQYKNNSFLSCIIDILTCNKSNTNINIDTRINIPVQDSSSSLINTNLINTGDIGILEDISGSDISGASIVMKIRNANIRVSNIQILNFGYEQLPTFSSPLSPPGSGSPYFVTIKLPYLFPFQV